MKRFCEILLFLVVALFASCSNKPEPNFNNTFEFYFQNCIQVIAMREGGASMPLKEIFYAHSCLEALTGVKSSVAKDGDTPYFYPYLDSSIESNLFFQDVLKWNYWLATNRDRVNMDMANEVLREYSNKQKEHIRWPKMYDIIRSELGH